MFGVNACIVLYFKMLFLKQKKYKTKYYQYYQRILIRQTRGVQNRMILCYENIYQIIAHTFKGKYKRLILC
jgi:hypothetical protein